VTTKNLDDVAAHHLRRARAAPNGRSAETVYGGHEKSLRQTVLTLMRGEALAEHDSPGEATLLVLDGRVALDGASGRVEGRTGDLLDIPDERHSLTALDDAAVLLTVAKSPARSHV
jgi:quercetin dioxygenase-like cupin family protein